MSFYNFETKSEQEFQDTLPDLHKLFQYELNKICLEKQLAASSFVFNQALGYIAPFGQCYEVSYSNPYSYGSAVYLECHMDGTNLVVDNFTYGR